MAGRNEGKGSANMKDRESKKFGQQFCKLFLATESGERLRIPPAFSQYLPNPPTGLVCLRGQSGNTWLVRLSSDTEGLFFGYGWKKFVMDHFIESGHILTFCYEGRSQFSVVVFDGMCIEKPSTFHAKPSKDLVDTIESDEDDNGMLVVPQGENNGTKKNTPDEIDANFSTLRKHSSGASVGYKSDNPNNTEEESISRNESSKEVSRLRKFSKDVDIHGKKNIHRNEPSKSPRMPPKFSQDVDMRGKSKVSDPCNLWLSTAIAKVQRQPEVTSQRPPVSEEQKNCALQRAKKYKSKHPMTMQIMKETCVYKTFFMILPGEFVRKHLPQTEKKFTLWDLQGRAWEVTYVYCSQRCSGAFSGGWGKFSSSNHLEKFDVCVFELFSEDNIRVHIYRANPALFPYLIDSEVNKGAI